MTAGEPDVVEQPDVVLRPATAADLPAVAAVHLAARAVAVGQGHMPPAPHPDATLLPLLAARFEAGEEIWVAERPDPSAGRVVGYLLMTETWVDDLYVHADDQGSGLGTALLDLAKARRPKGFGLWVFQDNTPARAFYERRGLVEVARTDGAGNDEGAPEVQLAWGVSVPAAILGVSGRVG